MNNENISCQQEVRCPSCNRKFGEHLKGLYVGKCDNKDCTQYGKVFVLDTEVVK